MPVLTKLELVGFKSFASKTVLEFPKNITAIVGPNGSGKSNITDAICWVLGEREAKHLRGERLENLIFAGTRQGPASSLAKVSIHFENSSGFLPLDFKEVNLVRKVDRSNTSEFFINHEKVTLNQLLEILAKARLGPRGLTVVRQGQTDVFIASLPEQRREIIEEFLGLKQFRIKKNKAELRLKSTQNNIERAKAVFEELKSRLRVLRHQANLWERRKKLEQQLKEYQDVYFAYELKKLKDKFRQIEPEYQDIQQKISYYKQEIKKLEEKARQLNQPKFISEKLNSLEKQEKLLLDEQSKLQKRLWQLEAELKREIDPKVLASLISRVKQTIKDCLKLDDLKRLKKNLLILLQEIEHQTKSTQYKSQLKQLSNQTIEQINQLKQEFLKLKQDKKKLILAQQEYSNKIRDIYEAMNQQREKLNILLTEENRPMLEKERLNVELENLRNRIIQAGRNLQQVENLSVPVNLDIDHLERKISRLTQKILSIGEVDQLILKEKQQAEEKFNFLNEQLNDLEKTSADLKILIKQLEQKIQLDFENNLNSINEQLKDYFRLLFGGGKIKLFLDEQGGIDISLRLPRKKFGGLKSLSGGEKSLVSLAILFSLISISPPPFLVLDEVDAALDEQNVLRFTRLVKQASLNTQFIIITHNRATMEIADLLYGVSMGKDGASKVLSLKLES